MSVANSQSPQAAPSTPTGPVERWSDISPAVRQLFSLIEYVWFGRIEDVYVRDGEPILSRPPRAVRTLKISGRSCPPAIRPIGNDRVLSDELKKLHFEMQLLGYGLLRRIEVGHGQPLFVEVVDDAAPLR